MADERDSQPVGVQPLTVEQEGGLLFIPYKPFFDAFHLDAIIHTRITNDERSLRRVLKKFHNYTAVAYNPIIPSPSVDYDNVSIEDAREAFLVELASFHLSLKKSIMICEAEARQVEEYQREKQRIGRRSL
jgi:hypothetical protein